MAFGTAVHAALEKFYRRLLEQGVFPAKEFLFRTVLKLPSTWKYSVIMRRAARLKQENKFWINFMTKPSSRKPTFIRRNFLAMASIRRTSKIFT